MSWLRRVIIWTSQFYFHGSAPVSASETHAPVVVDEEVTSEADETFNKMFEIFALAEMSLKDASNQVLCFTIQVRKKDIF